MKKVLCLLVIALALVAFTACSDDEIDRIEAGYFNFELKNVSKEPWVLGYDLDNIPDVKRIAESYHYGEEFLLNPGKSQKGAYTESGLSQSDNYNKTSDTSFTVELICIAGQKKEKSSIVGEYLQRITVQGSYGKKPLLIEWDGSEFKWVK